MEGLDLFLHNLAVTLAGEAEIALHECDIDPEEEGIILHLGEAFMLSLKGIVNVRKHQRKVQP